MDSRPPPPTGAPPPYAFVGRMYKRSLRPIVMGCCVTAAVWSFLWGASALQDVAGSNLFNKYDIALGVLYLTVGLIEVFGTIAAAKQHLGMVRVYVYLSVLAATIVVTAECMRLGIHFSQKSALIDACTKAADGATFYSWGNFWGSNRVPVYLSAEQAHEWCSDRWSRGVWSTIAWLVVASLLGWFFSSLAYSYYHQLLSPQTIPPSEQFRLGQLRTHQPPGPYAPYNPHGGYQYPAPRGPPEDYVPPYDPHKAPDYYPSDDPKHMAGPEKDDHSPVGPSSSTSRLGHVPDDRSRNV